MRAALLRRLRTRRTLRRLRAAGGDAAAAIAEALRYTPSPEERDWIARIEAERSRLERSDAVVSTPLSDYTLDPAHEHVFEDRVGDLCRRASKPADAALFLFALLRLLRPGRALELGTALGISAAYQGAALELNGSGRLITIDGSAARVEVARELLTRLSLGASVDSRLGRFQDVVPEVLSEEPVGYAFVDGHHDEQATLDYLDLIHARLAAPAVVVFDDVTWSDGMARAWDALRADARVETAFETLGMGVCVYRRR